MTASHIFYIPLILLLGIILGVALGRRSAEVELREAERQRARKEARAREAEAAPDGSATPTQGAEVEQR